MINNRNRTIVIGFIIILLITSVFVSQFYDRVGKMNKQNEGVTIINPNEGEEESIMTTTGRKLIYEAEEAQLTGLAVGEDQTASGGKFVEGFDAEGDRLRFVIHLDEPGTYIIVLRYRTFGGDKLNWIHLNGEELAEFSFRQAAEWNEAFVGQYAFEAGEHNLDIVHSWGWIAVDQLILIGGPSGPVTS